MTNTRPLNSVKQGRQELKQDFKEESLQISPKDISDESKSVVESTTEKVHGKI